MSSKAITWTALASDNLPGVLALGLIAGFAAWSLGGSWRLRRSSAAHLFRGRTFTALIGLMPCFGLTLVAMTLRESSLFVHLPIAVLSGVAFLAHCATDPGRRGFWHHRRLRPVGVAATGAFAVGLAMGLPIPELIPLAFAAMTFHRHQRETTEVMVRCFEDVEGLRGKLLSLDAARRLKPASDTGTAPVGRENWHDKHVKAG